MPNSILTGLAAGDVDCQYWERRDLGDFHRDNVVLWSLELIYTSAFGAFGCFVAVSVCVCVSVSNQSVRTKQYMSDVGYLGKPLLFLPAALALSISSSSLPEGCFFVSVTL